MTTLYYLGLWFTLGIAVTIIFGLICEKEDDDNDF
jgi:hypothetical protein